MATAATMRDRFAGQLVIDETLRRQLIAPPRTSVQRFFGSCPLSDDARPWYLGAVGEIAVGGILERLPEGWSARHALPVGTKESDIDHVVVGPGGVFTINTKHHAGKNIWVAGRAMLVDGQSQQYIRNAEGESARLARLLGERMPHHVPVHPLIVLVDPKRIMVKVQPERVRVLNSHEVRRWLKQQPETLNADAVTDLLAVIDDPALWRATDAGDPAEARRHFAELHDQVQAARSRRRLWVFAGVASLAALTVCLWALMPTAIPQLFGSG